MKSAFDIVITPLVTEKNNDLAAQGKLKKNMCYPVETQLGIEIKK